MPIPLSMALYDFLPNGIFALGAYWLWRGPYRSWIFLTGAGLVFINGITKALWKLIIATGGPDIAWLSEIFVFLLPTGFVLMFIASLRAARAENALARSGKAAVKPAPILAVPPLMAVWKIPFMVLATLAVIGTFSLWIAAAAKRKNTPALIGFVGGLACMLGMSALSGSSMVLSLHWVAQTVNTVGQAFFAFAAYSLTRPQRVR